MKAAIKTLCLVLALSPSSHAFNWGEIRYNQYPDEDSIQQVDVYLGPNKDLHVSGITYDGKFRLQAVTGQMPSVFVLSGPEISNLGVEGFISQCEKYRTRGLFDYVKKDKNRYFLEGVFYPLNVSAMKDLLPGLENETYVADATFLIPLDNAGPYSQSSKSDVSDIRRQLESQLKYQQSTILANGRMKLDLTGLDALACDLVSKKTQLPVSTNLIFAAPLPLRTPAISVNELSAIIRNMEDNSKAVKSPRDAIAMNALLQNDAMKTVLNKDYNSFGVARFLKLSNDLSEATGKMKVRSDDLSQIKKVARSYDEVRQGSDSTNVKVYPDIQVKVQ